MRHTEQYIQVEAIVTKYEKLVSNTKFAIKRDDDFISYDFYMEQLLGYIYKLRAGNSANYDVIKEYEKYFSCYVKGLLEDKEEQFLVDNFTEFVDYAFDHSSRLYTFGDGEFEEPIEWSSLVSCILNNKTGKIFIAYSNEGREFVELDNCELTVSEGFEDAAIRALSCGKKINKYKNIDGRLWSNIEDGHFDTVIIDMRSNWHDKKLYIDMCFNECYRIIKDGGEILFCISKEAIFSEDTIIMRDKLKREQLLQEGIFLPSGNILFHIVKKSQDKFVMYDASQQISERKNTQQVVDIEAFKKTTEMLAMQEYGECPIINRYDYNILDSNMLLPSYYLYFPKDGIPIGEFTSMGFDQPVLSDECGLDEKVVTVNHLSTVFTKSEFKITDLPMLKHDRLRRYYRVNGPAVIMAISEQDIAIGYTTDSASYLVPRNLYVLKPNNNLEVGYLAAKLLSKPLKKQIVALVCGKGIEAKLAINWEQFVCMDLQSSFKQQQFVQDIILNDYAIQESYIRKQEKDFKHAIRLRKHALMQNISALDSLFRSLEYCMSEHQGHIKSTDQLSPINPITVGKAMEILHADLEIICHQVEHLTDSNNWGKCEPIEPQSFIESYEKQHSNAYFRFTHLWEEFETNVFSKDVFDKQTGKLLFRKGESMNMAWFPRKALLQVFDNIVANACEHGFKDKSRNDYIIQTSWDTDGLNMLIKISNNGESLPEDLDADLVLEYGFSTALNQNGHSGIGGGEIAEIMHKFGGDVRVISSPEKRFTVTYVLKIPLASLY